MLPAAPPPSEQTGINTNYQAGQVAANANALSSADQFNSMASIRLQPSPVQTQPKDFNPSSVFANMKNNKAIMDESSGPQSSGPYSLPPCLASLPQ